MDKSNPQPCFKCYHYNDRIFISDTVIPAHCNHPSVYEDVRTQHESGFIYFKKVQKKDIIDLVDEDNNCPCFQKFKLVLESRFLWFKKYKKVIVSE